MRLAPLLRTLGAGRAILLLALAFGACKKDGLSPKTVRDSAVGGTADSQPALKDTSPTPKDLSPDLSPPVKLGLSKCIEDWPSAGGPHLIKPSLTVDAPKVLWKTQHNGFQSGNLSDAGPVLSKDRLVFQAGDWVYFINKDGTKPQTVKYGKTDYCTSGLVADMDGNVYYTAPDAVYSLDSLGKLRWSVANGSLKLGPAGGSGCLYGLTPVFGPDGVLYAATNDEVVRAFRASDGKVLWSQPAPADKYSYSRVMGGAGKALFVAFGREHTDALDTRDGSNLGSFVDPTLGQSFTWDWSNWVEGWDIGIAAGRLVAFDVCGHSKWATSITRGSGVVAAGEALVTGSKGTLILYAADGNVAAGPAPAEGIPIAAGADGTVYTFRCDDIGMTSTNRILAYSYDLKELWRLDLSARACLGITGNVVLDDDGTMYLSRPGESTGAEIIAIQTRSPGLANSSWPSFRHDNRGTAWLVPGSPAAATDAAAAPEAKDAPIDYLPSD